jgi:uncharacterized protein YwqG
LYRRGPYGLYRRGPFVYYPQMETDSRKAIAQSLADFGLRDVAANLASEARNALAFTSIAKPDGDVPIGATKLGGNPDMPSYMPWPTRPAYARSHWYVKFLTEYASELRHAEKPKFPFSSIEDQVASADEDDRKVASLLAEAPLSFIGQFRLDADMAARTSLDHLPKFGRLLLFYDEEAQPWGSDPDDVSKFRLIYDDSAEEALSRREPPGPAVTTFPSAILEPLDVVTALPPDTYITDSIVGPRAAYSRLREWWFEVYRADDSDSHAHQLGGWPDVIQNDMQEELQYVSNGIVTGAPEGYDEGRKRGLTAGARDWVLLLQISSDETAGMQWGDDGCLYVWIRQQDLRDRNFDKARLILQCY